VAFAVLGVSGLAGIGFVRAEADEPAHLILADSSQQKAPAPARGSNKGRGSFIVNGFDVGAEADVKVSGRFESEGKWAEVVAIAQISENKVVAWGPDGKKSRDLAKIVEKEISPGGTPELPGGGRPLLFSYGMKNRYLLVKTSHPSQFSFLDAQRQRGFGLNSGNNTSGNLQIFSFAVEKQQAKMNLRCLFTGGDPSVEEIPWPLKVGDRSKSGEYVVEEVGQFASYRDFLAENRNRSTSFAIAQGESKHGWSMLRLTSRAAKTTGQDKLEILDKAGKVLSRVNKEGDLVPERGAFDTPMTEADMEEFMLEARMDAYVGLFQSSSGEKRSFGVYVPTKKLDNVDRLRITRTPRVLVDFVDVPLDPK